MKLNKIKGSSITDRKKILEDARVALKEKFFGIDDVIDEFINSVESWYLYPDLRTKPLVVNLWGITGVGKTDLVRTFARLVKKAENYYEIESGSTDVYLLKDFFFDNQITADSDGILFIDEFQKLRTVNEKDEEDQKLDIVQDLWSLLSDGTFPTDPNLRSRAADVVSEINANYTPKKKLSGYIEVRVRRIINELMPKAPYQREFTAGEAVKFINQLLKRENLYSNTVYSKLLIIIGGNLDEAFYFSRSGSSDADMDADLYNEMSKRIKITNIKNALLKRFRPEQIARLGNLHIVYPVLDVESYKKIIDRYISDFSDRLVEKFGITIEADKTIKDAIYANGVFPIQGVRPLFGTLTLFIDNSMSSIICKLMCNDDKVLKRIKTIVLKYEVVNKVGRVIGYAKNVKIEPVTYEVNAKLDSIRDDKTRNMSVIHSVHEAGHAITQAILFNVAPRQIKSTTTSTSAGGFCTIYRTSESRTQLINEICVTLGGRAAEEIVFGRDAITSGAYSDLREATSIVMDYNLMLGMDKKITVRDDDQYLHTHEDDVIRCNDIVASAYEDTLKLISKNRDFLTEVSDYLIEKKEMRADTFAEVAKKYGLNLSILNDNKIVEENYDEMYNKFKKN